MQRSPAPLRGALACVLLTALNPLLAAISTPVSVNWSGVGLIAGFFCFFGVFVSLITLATDYFFPDVPSYSAWHGFAVARYLLVVLAGFGALALVRHFLVQKWYSGPIKVILDIARYVGDPRYRQRTLARLDEFAQAKQEGSNDLILVAHSLGSIIALDYLRNWRGADPVAFAREALRFEPDARQAQVLTTNCSQGLLNCTRQWGKSTITALKAVHAPPLWPSR